MTPFAAEKFLPQGLADISAQTAQKDVAGLRAFPSMQRPDTSQEHVRFKTASPLVNITDEDIDRGMNVALSAGPGMIKAYHGSPHDFGAFDSSKIGTGEGAQAYGHGLYFADNEGVAKSYRDTLSKQVNVSGGQLGSHPMDSPLATAQHSIVGDVANGIDPAEAIATQAAKWREAAEPYRKFALENPEHAADAHQQANSFEEVARSVEKQNPADYVKNPGHMYEVNINADPEHFLDWDKPFAEQSQHVRDILQNDLYLGLTPKETGQAAYNQARPLFPPTEDAARPMASQKLQEAGIPGIKYLDQGSRGNVNINDIRGSLSMWEKALSKSPTDPYAVQQVNDLRSQLANAEKSATSNYVVFDDKLIDILRKYGITGAPAAGIMASMAEEQNKNRATGGRINDNNAALRLAYQVKKERGHHEKFQSHG